MQLPPWTVLAGFGSLTRRELSDLLAVFEDTTLLNVVAGRARDLASRVRKRDRPEADGAFQCSLKEASARVFESDRSDAVLRLQLWHTTRKSLDLEAAIPLATRTANLHAAEVAQRAANELRESFAQAEEQSSRTDIPGRVWSRAKGFLSSSGPADFSEVVGAQAARMLAEAAQEGGLDEATRETLIERVRERLRLAPPELRDQSVEHALKAGDATALTLLTTGSSLAGVGIAVELAGFSAYILAAQASAILPLIGGQAVVSGLAVLANPLFIVPVVIGSGALAGRGFRRSARTKLASSLTIQMALTGMSSGRTGLATILSDFRSLSGEDVQVAGADIAQIHNRKIDLIGDLVGTPLPQAPGRPPEALDKPPTGRTRDDLEQVLFPDQRGVTGESIVVGGLTVADIVYHAAAIEPEVLRAADFSRSEDLSGVFDFGVFADRVRHLGDAAGIGAESHLRGYVAEQIVATRLVEQGHQVELPGAANNAGFDLIVDGTPCQVKCLNDLRGLIEHFETYPEIPVYVNAELADSVRESGHDWTDKVSFVEGYDHVTAETIMQRSLDAGAALNDLHILVFAVAASAARNVHAWWKGSLSLQDLPFEVAVDASVKGGLAVAGGFAGQSIGFLLFGPAGAVVFGTVGGTGALFAAGRARDLLDQVLDADWARGLDDPAEDFRVSLKRAMRRKIEILEDKICRLGLLDGEIVPWIRLRLLDDAVAIAEGVAELEFDVVERKQPRQAWELLRVMRDAGVHRWSVGSELTDLMARLPEKPTAGEAMRSIVDKGMATVSKRLPGRGE